MQAERWQVWRNPRPVVVLSLHAFIVWFACGLTIALGREALGVETSPSQSTRSPPRPSQRSCPCRSTSSISRLTTPLATAAFFTLFIVLLDALVVAPVFVGSYAMFSRPLGTWLPLLSIFAATYLTGVWTSSHEHLIPAEH